MKKQPILYKIAEAADVADAELEAFTAILRQALLTALRDEGFLRERELAMILGETEWAP